MWANFCGHGCSIVCYKCSDISLQMQYSILQMQHTKIFFFWILIIKTLLKIQELFIFFESERIFSKFQLEITFLKFASMFSLMYTTYVVQYTTNAVYYAVFVYHKCGIGYHICSILYNKCSIVYYICGIQFYDISTLNLEKNLQDSKNINNS